jgi:GNAT superfamily N-acetyltransferase
MEIQVRRAEYREVEPLREMYRQEAQCQIVRDSALARGFADAYLMTLDGRLAGYAAVGTTHASGSLLEFYTLPQVRADALALCRDVLALSQATQIEAQTNIPLMLLMLYDCARNITAGPILFEDALTTHLPAPDAAVFRSATADDKPRIFPHQHEPVGDWLIEVEGVIVASGGFLTHYNPPYGDIFMEVAPEARRCGYGSFLVQELKRVCYAAGKIPAARCDATNIASRLTLQKAGLLPCARLLVGEVIR